MQVHVLADAELVLPDALAQVPSICSVFRDQNLKKLEIERSLVREQLF